MTKKHIALVAGTVMSLGLVAGCGGGDGSAGAHATKQAGPKASASAGSKGPVYKGDRVPGLAKQAAWSLADKDEPYNCAGDASDDAEAQGNDYVCAVGDAFLMTQDLSAPVEEGESRPQTAHFVGHLFDAATGKERKSFDIKCSYDPTEGSGTSLYDHVQVGTWKDGSPAVLVRACENTEASGLKKATVKTVYTMYAPNGEKLGSSSFTGAEQTGLPVVRGHVLLPGDDETRTLAPIGGGQNLVLPAAVAEAEPVGTGLGYATEGDGVNEPLSVIDRGTGKKVWSTTDLTPPAAVAAKQEDGEDADASFYPLHGDRAVLVWSPSGSDDAVLTTVDLKTGRTLATGPSVTLDITHDDDRTVVSPDGKTAVVQYGEGAVAWDTESGAELWRQEADDKDIEPLSITPGGVLYADLGDSTEAALNVRTKKLLSTRGTGSNGTYDFPEEFSADGYGLVHTQNAAFVFASDTV
ncbi:PQQ-binding-like beta-propeller repeat protein [Streptomyces avermitilis]|uniref:outer membrane protein assembly factor BamB family protein n=1 Tax=Streptomyces avermitilis TaxID=33903 RepID=UPI0033D4DC04